MDRWTRTAAAKLLPRAGRGRPELLFQWGLGPRSWLRILAKLPGRLWGRWNCLNPVPQERHLLVIGTMEMAGWVLDLALGSELPRRQKGKRWDSVGAGGGFALPPQSSTDCSHIHQVKASQVKSAANPLGEGRSQGRRQRKGEEGPEGGRSPHSASPLWGRTPSSSVQCAPGPGVPGQGWAVSRPSRGAPPHPGTKIARRRAPRCSQGTTGMPAGAGGLWPGPPWRRWGRACTSPQPGWSSPAPPAARGPHP